jgi:crossover junction endodeoxyribonuclease RuvC
MVKVLLNLPEVAQEDAADALAVAICHANSRALKMAVANAGRR